MYDHLYKILVVDDEMLVRWSIGEALKKIGFEVHCAGSIDEADSVLMKTECQLLITDLKLPSGDGFTVLEHAREVYPDCPCIIITSYGDDSTRQKAKDQLVDQFFDKPVNLPQIIWSATRLIRDRENSQ